jgi:hypothetical protein
MRLGSVCVREGYLRVGEEEAALEQHLALLVLEDLRAVGGDVGEQRVVILVIGA